MKKILKRFQQWNEYELPRFSNWIRLELSTTYRFPVIEGIVALLLFVSLQVALPLAMNYSYLQFQPGSGWDGQEALDELKNDAQMISSYLPIISVYAQLFSFLLPMLVAYSLSRGFEDGTFKTFLSYPISRVQLLGLKITLSCFVTCAATIFAFISATALVDPEGQYKAILLPTSLTLILLVLFINLVTALMAVLSKNVVATSFAGLITCFGITAIGPLSYGLPLITRGIFNPPFLIVQLYNGKNPTLTLFDVFIASFTMLGISLVISIIVTSLQLDKIIPFIAPL